VTAENKMQAAQEITQSYDGELVQTLRFPFGSVDCLDRLRENLDYIRGFLGGLGAPATNEDGLFGWVDVPTGAIQDFLDRFWVMTQTSIHPPTVRNYIHEQSRLGELVRWRVLVHCQARPTEALGREDLGIVDVGAIGLISRSRLKSDPTSLGVITDPGDELYGLSDEDIGDAEVQAALRKFPTRGKAYRSKRCRKEGLLILYPISGNSAPTSARAANRTPLFAQGAERCTVLGYAVSFPFSNSPATVTYVQGPESRRR
jgi:hypothetical protein